MKMTIKRLLKKYGYPPDQTAKAVDIVMEQTKLMSILYRTIPQRIYK
ncbi:MAG: type I restriction enzyme endonuclease domain-containing protein [Desulfitobacteriaceae bacterium]